MATLQQANQAARDLETASFPNFPNHAGLPSLKYALWAAALSTQRDLDRNGRLVDTLRPYVTQELPKDPQAVLAILKAGDRFCCIADAHHVLYVEWADNEGLLDPFKTQPRTYADWLRWRIGLFEVLTGHGFSYKTISFAGLLCWPTSCPLVPVDRHVVARLGGSKAQYESLGDWQVYSLFEHSVIHEWIAAGQPYTPGIWHWYTWEQWRQTHPTKVYRRVVQDVCESHKLLSPYAW